MCIRDRAGPVGSGKTALIEALSRKMANDYSIGVITNDIYTKEDAQFLAKNSVLPVERIIGVETGGCPHTAIREDASMNLEAVDEMMERFPDIELLFIESGGDNLSATFLSLIHISSVASPATFCTNRITPANRKQIPAIMTRALSAPHLICTGIMMEMVMKNTARKTGIIPAFSERTPDTFETPCTSRDTRYNAQARTNDTTVPATQNRYFSRI